VLSTLFTRPSGLDARAALLVVNALRKMADQGRTIVATIHQPSSTVFDMFDDLLLLKKGGEVVYHGELGITCFYYCSMFGVVYIAFIIIGQLSITSIIPVTISMRDMYYRHHTGGLLQSRSFMTGLLAAELPFISAISLSFPVIFVALFGLPHEGITIAVWRTLSVFLFFAMNTAIYSYIGEDMYMFHQLCTQNSLKLKE